MMLLLLGGSDMEQVIEASAAILDQHDAGTAMNMQLVRALETGLVVCYWRPFSQANSMGCLREKDAVDSEVHAFIREVRNQTHAHIDEEGERRASVSARHGLGFTPEGGFAYHEDFWGLGEEWVERIAAVAAKQRDAWRAEAVEIRDRLAEAD